MWFDRKGCFLPAQMIHAELSKLVKKYSDHREVEQAMYKKMLGNTSANSNQEKKANSWVRVSLFGRHPRSSVSVSGSSTLSSLLLPGSQLEVAVRCRCRGHRWRSIICLHSCQRLSTVHCDDVTIRQQRGRLKHRSTSGSAF